MFFFSAMMMFVHGDDSIWTTPGKENGDLRGGNENKTTADISNCL